MRNAKMHFGPRTAGILPLTASLLFYALPARPAQPSPAAKTNSSSSPKAKATASPDLIPKELKLSWRSLSPTAAILAGTAEWNGKSLKYEAVRTPSAEPLKTDKRSVVPNASAWQEFSKALDENKVWNWAPSYPSQPGADKGISWQVAIKWGNREVKSSGTRGYPGAQDVAKPSSSSVIFNRFWYALDRLAAEPIEVEGRFFAGSETSRFTPSTHAFRGEMWWLESNADFNKRYEKFRPIDQTGTRLGGAEVMTRLRGRLVGPGAYGHLNQYPYEIIVDEVLEMKSTK